MVSAGALLWISCRPLIKMAICISCGFTLSKLDMFSTLAARDVGKVLLNVMLPSLMFSKMVPAFNSQNIAAVGPLAMMGVIYHLIGLVISLIVRELFWTPHRFRSGIIVAGTWSNYGDIPTAVIMSITAGAPFKSGDSDLGVAYISVFLLVFFITLFPSGGHTWIAKDFEGPDKEDEEVKSALKERQKRILSVIKRRFEALTSCWRYPEDNDVENSTTERDSSIISQEKSESDGITHISEQQASSVTLTSRVLKFIRTFLTPNTIAILLAFPISLIRPLKALFVPLANSPIPKAPDGNPPLYFIYDTTNFLGAATLPFGLVCLGAALAKMKLPKDLRKLPLGAITGLAVGKLIISPILGVAIVNSFVKIGFIHEEDKVLRFVAIFFSCMPTATTQVFLTQAYSGTGEAEHLAAFLILQYALLFISMTTVTAYSLHLLF